MGANPSVPLIVACLLTLPPVGAHAAAFAGWEVQAGASSSSFGGELHDAVGEWRGAFTGGAGIRVRLVPWLSLQPEVRWISKGGGTGALTVTRAYGPASTLPSIEWVVNYVDLPVLARIEVPSAALVHPYLLVGSGLAIKAGGEVRANGSSLSPSPQLRYAQIFEGLSYSDRKIVDRFRDVDLDATVGLGVGLGRGARRVTIEARWTEGLLDPLPDGALLGARNRAFAATLGYAWR